MDEAILELLHSISTRLDNVATKDDIATLSRRVEEIEADLEEIEEDYKKLNLFINGNGVPGAKTRLALLEREVESVQKKYRAITDDVVNKITIRLVKVIGIPLLLSIILWVVKVIYDSSVHLQLP